MQSSEHDSRIRPIVYLGLAAGSFILAHYSPLAVISAFGFEGLAAWRIIRHLRNQKNDTEVLLPTRFKRITETPKRVIELTPTDGNRTTFSLPTQPKETHR